ncbi:ASCH domain-containing protein [Deinococcus sp. UYEF24]
MTELSPEVLAFVLQAEAELGRRLLIVEAFQFGDSPAMADELAALVMSGQKRATCGWPINPEIATSSYSVMLNGRGAPLAVLGTVEVRELPFLEVEAQFAHDEGEGDRTLSWWREAHRRFFGRQPGDTPWDDDQVVQCERFAVIWRPTPGETE